MNTLSINFAHSVSKQATIFANGSNQIELLVTLSMQDLDNKPLEISSEELKKAIYLCDYRTGEQLEDPWIISFKENKFNRAISYQDTSSADTDFSSVDTQRGKLSIRMYVSAKSLRNNALIAVGIGIPGVGDFDTTEDGIGVSNGPGGESGSPFKSPKYVSIKLASPINYSDSANLEVEAGDFVTIDPTMKWDLRYKNNRDIVMENKTGGVVKKRVFRIKPRSDIPDNKFLESGIEYAPVKNEEVNQENIDWDKSSMKCFNLLDKMEGYPCAVLSREHEGSTPAERIYDLNLWFSNQYSKLNIEGSYFFDFDNMEGRIKPGFSDDHNLENTEGRVLLFLYKIYPQIYRSWAYKLGWKNVAHEATLKVTDLYGNKGTTRVNFDTDEYYDIPHIN